MTSAPKAPARWAANGWAMSVPVERGRMPCNGPKASGTRLPSGRSMVFLRVRLGDSRPRPAPAQDKSGNNLVLSKFDARSVTEETLGGAAAGGLRAPARGEAGSYTAAVVDEPVRGRLAEAGFFSLPGIERLR